MITAHALRRVFGKTVALDDITLTIETGEMFALIGPDGAGKTTFFRIAAGLLAPSRGTMRNDGSGSFGFVPQRFSLYQDLSVDENLVLRARLYGVPATVARKRAAELLARVGLDRFGARLAGALSGGMKQKLALVAALLIEPRLLLLDEPTTGVDPLSRREFWATLHQLHHQGLTVVVSTPYMDEAAYATRLGFLHHGRLLACGSRTDVIRSYSRTLVEVSSHERVAVRSRLASVPEIDDVSLFGTVLHVRGAAGIDDALVALVRHTLADIVPAERVLRIEPSLEDVFVLNGDMADGLAGEGRAA
jgi:ABC-2 type transport system ATP-binding protein